MKKLFSILLLIAAASYATQPPRAGELEKYAADGTLAARTQKYIETGNHSDGLLIWHVDATPNADGDDFLYNNSVTEHKLLRLMEANGLPENQTLL